MVAGPLLNWYRQSRGLVLTRERMDSLLHLLQAVEPGLPRQVRTLERREVHQTPDDFAVNNMKRSIVCGNCALCEITECVSQCKFLVLGREFDLWTAFRQDMFDSAVRLFRMLSKKLRL
jgi:hypothetical protein